MIPLGCSIPKNSSQFTNKKRAMRGNDLHLFLSLIKPKTDSVRAVAYPCTFFS